jgi:hypothetical protein
VAPRLQLLLLRLAGCAAPQPSGHTLTASRRAPRCATLALAARLAGAAGDAAARTRVRAGRRGRAPATRTATLTRLRSRLV